MTQPLRISEIHAKSLRGATQATTIKLPDAPITLIFGENGTGKSTLIDAIDWVLCEKFGSLDEISGAKKSHFPSLGAESSQMQAAIVCGSHKWTATVKGKNGVSVTPADGRPSVTILRRTKIQRLIASGPTERFNELKDYIDVGGLDVAEDELGKATRTTRKNLDSASNAITNQTAGINTFFEQQRSPEEAALEPIIWLKNRAAVDISLAKKEQEVLSKAYNAYTRIVEQTAKAQQGMEVVKQKKEAAGVANAEFKQLQIANPQAAQQVHKILVDALQYLEVVPDAKKCPVCRNPIQGDNLRAKIQERLKSQPVLQACLKKMQDTEMAKTNEENIQKEKYRALVASAAAFFPLLSQLPDVFLKQAKQIASAFPDLLSYQTNVDYDEIQNQRLIAEAESIAQRFQDAATTWNKRQIELGAEVGASDYQKKLLKDYEKALLDAKQYENSLKKLQDALPILQNARKNYVQNVLEKLADDCDHIYQSIHPDEKINNIRFALDMEKRAAVEQSVDMDGHQGIIPQAYLSDSHLDTLSFSFFLAMAHQGNSKEKIFIVDDIFTSEDEQHLLRIGELLIEEASNFSQIILTTHLRKWFDWARGGDLPRRAYGVVELSPHWSLENGVRTKLAEAKWTEIEQLCQDPFPDRVNIAAKTRQFLEAVLGPIVLNMKCTAPMKRYGDYELSDYLCALRSLAKDGWQVVSAVPPIPGLLCEPTIHDTYNLREKTQGLDTGKAVLNKLVHASEEGAHYTDGELRDAAKEALELHRYLFCEKCGTHIGKSGKFRTCHCGKWRLDQRPAEKDKKQELKTEERK